MENKNKLESVKMDKDFFEIEALFRSRYSKIKAEKEAFSSIPEEVEKTISAHAAFSLQKRMEKKRQWRKFLYAAACAVMMTFVFVLIPENREKRGFAKKNDLVKTSIHPQKGTGKSFYTSGSSAWEYDKYTESNDAADCELYSLNAQLDMASLEAELIGHHS
ncbi:MAG: hypothetical protein J6S53_11470 [Lentisphaeria bacterium]|nr:hypothetical protein [Lentisphaeria bacterium]